MWRAGSATVFALLALAPAFAFAQSTSPIDLTVIGATPQPPVPSHVLWWSWLSVALALGALAAAAFGYRSARQGADHSAPAHPERAGSGLEPTGATNLLMKPFTADTLAARIKEMITGKPEADGWNF